VIRSVWDSAPAGAELPESKYLELGCEVAERVDGGQSSVQVKTFGRSDGRSASGKVNACGFDARGGFQSSPHTADTGNTSGHSLDSEGHCFDGRVSGSFLR
jgi:hypothetical protein